MPRVSRRGAGGNESTQWPAARITALGEFLGLARWIVTPITRAAYSEKAEPQRPATVEKENFAEVPQSQGDEAPASDTELGPLLGAIVDDVHRRSAAAREGVMADFAASVAHAKRHLPRSMLAATLSALAQARKAALAFVNRSAALELAARKKAAIMARGRMPANHALRGLPRQRL